jgi:hypothetical protein
MAVVILLEQETYKCGGQIGVVSLLVLINERNFSLVNPRDANARDVKPALLLISEVLETLKGGENRSVVRRMMCCFLHFEQLCPSAVCLCLL